MNKLIQSLKTFSLSLAFVAAAQSFAAPSTSETRIIDNQIRYARTLHPADRNGFSYPMAIVGGNVLFQGTGPVYVTLRIGGQTHTALTDSRGDYSFFAYTAGAGRFEVEAWVINPTDAENGSKLIKSGSLSVQK